jgi:hypothetical protein
MSEPLTKDSFDAYLRGWLLPRGEEWPEGNDVFLREDVKAALYKIVSHVPDDPWEVLDYLLGDMLVLSLDFRHVDSLVQSVREHPKVFAVRREPRLDILRRILQIKFATPPDIRHPRTGNRFSLEHTVEVLEALEDACRPGGELKRWYDDLESAAELPPKSTKGGPRKNARANALEERLSREIAAMIPKRKHNKLHTEVAILVSAIHQVNRLNDPGRYLRRRTSRRLA